MGDETRVYFKTDQTSTFHAALAHNRFCHYLKVTKDHVIRSRWSRCFAPRACMFPAISSQTISGKVLAGTWLQFVWPQGGGLAAFLIHAVLYKLSVCFYGNLWLWEFDISYLRHPAVLLTPNYKFHVCVSFSTKYTPFSKWNLIALELSRLFASWWTLIHSFGWIIFYYANITHIKVIKVSTLQTLEGMSHRGSVHDIPMSSQLITQGVPLEWRWLEGRPPPPYYSPLPVYSTPQYIPLSIIIKST